MKRAALYARVSKAEQATPDYVSLDQQLADAHRLAIERGYEVVLTERDVLSGLEPERPGYQRILDAARRREIDVVIAWKWDRWGRDAAESIAAHRELGRLGILVDSVLEPGANDFMQGIFALVAEQSSRDTSQRTSRALRDGAAAMTARTSALLDAALSYAARGWPVLPLCWPDARGGCPCGGNHRGRDVGKAPVAWLVPHGLLDATTDAATIRAWWGKAPLANVGVRTGPESGLLVLDVDTGKGGMTTLLALEQQHGYLTDTVRALTGGGGEHHLYRYPPGRELRNSAEKLGPGLDVRATGGYIVAPPSLHVSGRRYEWDAGAHPDDVPLAAAPAWLLELLTAAPPERSGRVPAAAAAISDIIGEGQRNATLTSLAGSMRRRGMTEDEIADSLLIINARRVVPPLPEADIRKIARSVGRYAPAATPAAAPAADRAEASGPTHHAAPLPEISITDRQLPDISGEAFAALVAANIENSDDAPTIYVRGGLLVRARQDEKGHPVIEDLSEHALRGRLARVATWVRETDKGPRAVAPPMAVIKDIAALPEWPGIPPLVNVIESPALRPDGTVLDRPGYDPATALLYVPAPGLTMPPISAAPTWDEMSRAQDLIRTMLADFPFADNASRANMLAVLLTLVLRPAIPGPVPMFLFDAPQAGTGKGLLAEIAARIATGRPSLVMTAPKDDEEWRKKITTALMSGPSVIGIDNVEVRLDAASLAAALTAEVWQDRDLGRLRQVTVPQRAIWLATGNNIRLGGDLPRRCVWVRLNARMAHPWERENFQIPDLRGWVSQRRGDLLWALLTLCRGWYAAGCPQYDTPKMGSFEAWCATVGGVLGYYGLTDFLGNQAAMYKAGDDEGPQWEAFLSAWREQYRDAPRTVAQVTADMRNGSDLKDALPDDLAGALASEKGSFERRLGRALLKRVEKRYGARNLYIERAGEDGHARAVVWRVLE